MTQTTEQIALVTGGSRGLGAAVTKALARSGNFVCINYRQDKAGADDTLEQIKKKGGNGAVFAFDVADHEACDAAVKDIIHTHGKIDILINNAGVRKDGLLVRMKPKDWDAVVDINLNGFYNVTRCAVKNMIKNHFGKIVNITSASGSDRCCRSGELFGFQSGTHRCYKSPCSGGGLPEHHRQCRVTGIHENRNGQGPGCRCHC